MENSKIVEKLKKLMALSESPNPNEAGLALKRAQELMQKYGISKVDLTFADIAVKAKKAGNFKSVPAEIDILASTVKQLFQCEAFFSPKVAASGRSYESTVKFIGFSPNQEIAAYTFEVLLTKMKAARREYRKDLKEAGYNTRQINKFSRNYSCGWAIGVYGNIKHLIPPKVEFEHDTGVGLVKVNPLELYMNEHFEVKDRKRRTVKAGHGSGQGMADGSSVQINKAMNGNAARTPRIK